MNDKEKIIQLLDLLDSREAAEKNKGGLWENDNTMLEGFDNWFDFQCRKHYRVRVAFATLIVTSFVCITAWRLSPPVEVVAVDEASVTQRTELVMATKNVLNLI